MGTVANSQPVTAQVLTPLTKAPPRNIAMDAYRGFVMLLMMGEVLQFEKVYKAFPDSSFWRILAYNQTHVEWAGCSLHDMIQPSFSFLVGVALPYSLASRMAKGQTESRLFLHALWRSFLLIALGIFLRSTHSSQTYFTFEDTLTQIGLGYPFLFLLGLRQRKWQWTAFGLILFAYWLAWALYPLPPANFDLSAVGVPPDWHRIFDYSGFAGHWNKNVNLGNAFDQWFLNLFPREKPFVFNGGGYLTLSFIPTLGTMILGLVAGSWLREAAPRIPFKKFLIAATIGVMAGLLLHFTGICPIVKRIWTPAWTLFSGGVCFFFLAAFSWVIEAKGYKKWAFPLVVVGMNSIAAYLIAHLFEEFIADSLRINLGANFFAFLGTGLQPLLNGAAMLLTYWLILFWMYRRKLFLKI